MIQKLIYLSYANNMPRLYIDICIYEYLQEPDATSVGSPMPPFACHVLGPPAESLGMDAKIPRLGFKIGILESLMSFFVRLKKSHMSPLLLGS